MRPPELPRAGAAETARQVVAPSWLGRETQRDSRVARARLGVQWRQPRESRDAQPVVPSRDAAPRAARAAGAAGAVSPVHRHHPG